MAASVLGAAEIAYHAQSLPLFPISSRSSPRSSFRERTSSCADPPSGASPSSSASRRRTCSSAPAKPEAARRPRGRRGRRRWRGRRRRASRSVSGTLRRLDPSLEGAPRRRARRSPTSSSSSPNAPARRPSARTASRRTAAPPRRRRCCPEAFRPSACIRRSPGSSPGAPACRAPCAQAAGTRAEGAGVIDLGTDGGDPWPVDVLAIAAHPDDVELTCGGTLARLKASGYRFGIVDLTRGEMGTRGTAEIRGAEARAGGRDPRRRVPRGARPRRRRARGAAARRSSPSSTSSAARSPGSC